MRLKSSFTLAVVLFLAIELVMRTFFTRSLDGRFEYGYNPDSGFVEKADGTVELVNAGGRTFRPQSFSKAPRPGTYRIMVIGDSVSRGPSLEAAFPWQIKELLCAQGIKTECINMGLPGYGVRRKEIVLRKAIRYRPDLVILQVNNSNEYADEREYKRSQDFKGWHPRNWIMKSLLVCRLYQLKTESIFWKWLPAAIRNQKAVNDIDAKIAESNTAGKKREWDGMVRRYTAESVSLARAAGTPVLLVVRARKVKDNAGACRLDDDGVEALMRPLTGPGVFMLSMKDALSPFNFSTLYSADGSHLLPEGHRVMAGAIVRLILRERLTGAEAAGSTARRAI